MTERLCNCGRLFWSDGALLCPRCGHDGAVDAVTVWEGEVDSPPVWTHIEITPLTRRIDKAASFLVEHGPRKLGYGRGATFDLSLVHDEDWQKVWFKPGRLPFSDPDAWVPCKPGDPWARAFWRVDTAEVWSEEAV